jgi:O-antigen/teichoic acid export membrane protein
MKSTQSTSNISRNIFKNMLVLATGSGIAKLVGIASIPVITRIYSPEHLGNLSVFVAMAALIVPFGTLRYSGALPLPRSDALALNLAVASFSLLIIMSLFSIAVIFFSADPIMNMLSMPNLTPYWWLLSLAIFLAGLYEMLNSWATREKAFQPIAKTRISQSILSEITKIGLGLIGLKPGGLLIGHLVTQTVGILTLSRILLIKLKQHRAKIKKKRIIFLLKHYREYPKYRLPSQFLLVFSMQAPLLFSTWTFGAEVTGQLGLALMALALPIALFGQTTGQAYYAEIAKLGRSQSEKIYHVTKTVTIKLFLLSIPPFVVLIFFGPWLFGIIFGSEWGQAGVFASTLAIYLLMQFISTPIVNALSVFEKQFEFLMINIRRAFLIIVVYSLSYYLDFDASKTLLLFSIVLSFHYFWITFSILRLIKRNVL